MGWISDCFFLRHFHIVALGAALKAQSKSRRFEFSRDDSEIFYYYDEYGLRGTTRKSTYRSKRILPPPEDFEEWRNFIYG